LASAGGGGGGAGGRRIGAFADDRRGERHAHRATVVASRGRNSADRRAVAAFVADSPIAGNVAAGRIDASGEFVEGRIDAAVDNADLDALARRARVVGRYGIGNDRILGVLIFGGVEVGPGRRRGSRGRGRRGGRRRSGSRSRGWRRWSRRGRNRQGSASLAAGA